MVTSRFLQAAILALLTAYQLKPPLPDHPQTISGTVSGFDGKPRPAAEIYIVLVHGGDAHGISTRKADNTGRFSVNVPPNTYLITTDLQVASGGLNLLSPNVLAQHYKLEPGQDLADVKIRALPDAAPFERIKGCGFAQSRSQLEDCLVRTEKQTLQKLSKQSLAQAEGLSNACRGLDKSKIMALSCRIRIAQKLLDDLKSGNQKH